MMSDFIALLNPSGATEFTPDILIGFFGFCLVVYLIGGIIETLFKGVR